MKDEVIIVLFRPPEVGYGTANYCRDHIWPKNAMVTSSIEDAAQLN